MRTRCWTRSSSTCRCPITWPSPNPCTRRILLTDTVETTTVGNTILISKGLIDTLPSEESIASVVAMELAHIAMGHHIDTRYAFNDRLLFPDEATFQKIDMYHSDHDNTEAAKTRHGVPADLHVQGQAGRLRAFTMRSWSDRAKELKALNTPKLGDSLLQADGTPWMADLAAHGAEAQLGRSGPDAPPCRWAAGSRPIHGTTRCTC